jgi:hypothetical protein
VADIARDDRASRDRRNDPRSSWPPPPLSMPTTPHATAVATGPRVRRRRSSASGASSQLACPSQERCCRSFLVQRHRRSPVSRRHRCWLDGRHRCWPPGSAPLARPREPPPLLKSNPRRREVFYSSPDLVRLDRIVPSNLG